MKNLRTLFSLITGVFILFCTACAPQQLNSDKNQSVGTSSPMPVVAERADLEGKWLFTMSNPEQGTLTGNLLVQRGGAVGYSGRITVKEMRVEAETVWCNNFDGGRQWNTTLGHHKDTYANPVFMQHILGGLKWVAAKKLNYKQAYAVKSE